MVKNAKREFINDENNDDRRNKNEDNDDDDDDHEDDGDDDDEDEDIKGKSLTSLFLLLSNRRIAKFLSESNTFHIELDHLNIAHARNTELPQSAHNFVLTSI